ncbi:hypothetical protein KPL37_17990 [Clostridium frigoris]|uniref:Recombinase family protein n=1 Tax=Clostridium frigoris TaxID=205327 RepID=A0ABS6BYB8_9CLOT|nr:hypothetical protein [Clostridium frigoris]MBU3161599.1 hypothetical protein [Clostridium frigoris]
MITCKHTLIRVSSKEQKGILIAVIEGKYKGRKSIEVPKLWDKYYNMYKENTIKAVDVMKILKLKKTTFYKLINQYEESN